MKNFSLVIFAVSLFASVGLQAQTPVQSADVVMKATYRKAVKENKKNYVDLSCILVCLVPENGQFFK